MARFKCKVEMLSATNWHTLIKLWLGVQSWEQNN